MRSSQHGQALYTLSGGRIVNNRGLRHSIDPKRLGVAVAIIAILWCSNPLNTSSLAQRDDDVTNYGLFHVQERGRHLVLSAATFDWECPYQSILEQREGLPDWCSSLRRSLAHGKPLWYDPNDLSHTLHRCFVTILIALNILVACKKKHVQSLWRSGYPAVDAFLALWIPNESQPLLGLLWALLPANAVVAPVWQVLCQMVPLQTSDSWFRLLDHPTGDTLVTLFVLTSIPVLVNLILFTYWQQRRGTFLLRFDGWIAVILGYYRGVVGGTTTNAAQVSLAWLQRMLRTRSIVPDHLSVQAVTWTVAAVTALDSVPRAVAFLGANILGAQVGEYQFRHLGAQAALQKIVDAFLQLFGAK